jgi:hypothetical protein
VARAWLASDATHSRVVVGWVRRRVLARRSRARVGAAAGEGALAVARGAAASSSSDRWVLLKNPAQLTDTQSATLAAIRAAGGKVARAWAMKEMVRAIFAPGLTVEAVSGCSTGSWLASQAADCDRSSA